MRVLALLLWSLLSATGAISMHDTLSHLQKEMAFYSDVMVNAREADHRERAASVFDGLFRKYISGRDSMPDFTFIPEVSVLTSPDNNFRVVTWQIARDNHEYDYAGWIFRKDLPPLELTGDRAFDPFREHEILSPFEWYGAIYYDLLPMDKGSFLLFGFNGRGQWENLKVADVLTFHEDGSITFGAPLFEHRTDSTRLSNRLVFRYSADASFNLSYNPGMEMIIFDHLVRRMGRLPGQGPVHLPDGTYEGYEYVDGLWRYREKIYDHIYNDAPRPAPVLGGKKKDIFGNGY